MDFPEESPDFVEWLFVTCPLSSIYRLDGKKRKYIVKYTKHELAVKEKEILEGLSHPNIVTYFGTKKKSSELGIVMEFCESGSLYEVINNPKVIYTVTTVVTWTSQLFEALNYLKGKHIVHRDLKPHNIFLTKNFVLKLGDFGCHRFVERTIGCMDETGTPRAVLSEYTKTIQGVDTFDQSAFWLDVVMKTRTGTGPTPPECVKNFQQFVVKCTEFEYENRPTATEAIRDLKMFLEDPSLMSHDFRPYTDEQLDIAIRPIGFDGSKSNKIPIYTKPVESFEIGSLSVTFSDKTKNLIQNDHSQKEISIGDKFLESVKLSEDLSREYFIYPRKQFKEKFQEISTEEREDFVRNVPKIIETHYRKFNDYHQNFSTHIKDKLIRASRPQKIDDYFEEILFWDHFHQLTLYQKAYKNLERLRSRKTLHIFTELNFLLDELKIIKRFYVRRIHLKCYFSWETLEEWLFLRDLRVSTTRGRKFIRKDLCFMINQKIDEAVRMQLLGDEPLDISEVIDAVDRLIKKLETLFTVKYKELTLVNMPSKPFLLTNDTHSFDIRYVFQMKRPPIHICICEPKCAVVNTITVDEKLQKIYKLKEFHYHKCANRCQVSFLSNFLTLCKRFIGVLVDRTETGFEMVWEEAENFEKTTYESSFRDLEFPVKGSLKNDPLSRFIPNFFLFLHCFDESSKIDVILLDHPSNYQQNEEIQAFDRHFKLTTIRAEEAKNSLSTSSFVAINTVLDCWQMNFREI
ncbi:unnamed protein product, partial [Mesorhabditis belari]|uniref:non-specific serine/threonine protein kinase n=1 Tax=Mesorhabditis belari TaxID=2138241 RepID=A0AAF3F320_9BILA